MKKTLLASAITLSVFGLTTNLSYAEENKVQSTPVETTHSETSTDKVEKTVSQLRNLNLQLKQMPIKRQIQLRKKKTRHQKFKKKVGY